MGERWYETLGVCPVMQHFTVTMEIRLCYSKYIRYPKHDLAHFSSPLGSTYITRSHWDFNLMD